MIVLMYVLSILVGLACVSVSMLGYRYRMRLREFSWNDTWVTFGELLFYFFPTGYVFYEGVTGGITFSEIDAGFLMWAFFLAGFIVHFFQKTARMNKIAFNQNELQFCQNWAEKNNTEIDEDKIEMPDYKGDRVFDDSSGERVFVPQPTMNVCIHKEHNGYRYILIIRGYLEKQWQWRYTVQKWKGDKCIVSDVVNSSLSPSETVGQLDQLFGKGEMTDVWKNNRCIPLLDEPQPDSTIVLQEQSSNKIEIKVNDLSEYEHLHL